MDDSQYGSLWLLTCSTLAADKLCCAADVLTHAFWLTGRKPYVDKLALDKIGAELDDRGRIKVDEDFKTNVDGVYAIGDIISGPMLAHKVRS